MKVRIKFAKRGHMKFVGHLDMMRYFQKVMRRAGIDIAYSGGFSPHQIMSFAAPLGIGIVSEGEYLDIELHSCLTSRKMMDKLGTVMVDGIEILSFKRLPEDSKSAMSIVAGADYLVSLREGRVQEIINMADQLQAFYAQESINVLKKGKKSERLIDIKPFIHELTIIEGSIFMRLSTGSTVNIKPELVMEAFFQFLGIQPEPFPINVKRLEVYAWVEECSTNGQCATGGQYATVGQCATDGQSPTVGPCPTSGHGTFIPLDDFGEDICSLEVNSESVMSE